MTLTVPLWLVATLVYAALLAYPVLAKKFESTSDWDFFAPLEGCFWWVAATFAYLLFWVAYLALT